MPKTLICIPCMSTVHTEFMKSLVELQRLPGTAYAITINSLIYDARNRFAVQAITGEYDRMLFLDSDMAFNPDLMVRMAADMDSGCEYVSALVFTRTVPVLPVIYRKLDVVKTDGMDMADLKRDTGYPPESLFKIRGSGLGAVMVSVPLVRKVWDTFGPPFTPTQCLGEDLAFCYRVQQLGADMWCDSRIKTSHIGQAMYNEDLYRKQFMDSIEKDTHEIMVSETGTVNAEQSQT